MGRLHRLRSTIAALPPSVDTVAVVSHYGLINMMHASEPEPDKPVLAEMPFERLPNTGVVRSTFVLEAPAAD